MSPFQLLTSAGHYGGLTCHALAAAVCPDLISSCLGPCQEWYVPVPGSVLTHLEEDSCLSPHLDAGTSYANAEQAMDAFLDQDADFNDVSDSGSLKFPQLWICAPRVMLLQHTILKSS